MIRAALLASLLAVVGCAAPESFTIRELGQPAFEPLLGPQTRFVRATPQGGPQGQGLDAWLAEGDHANEHRAFLSVVPTGLPETVLLAVGVAGNPAAPPLARLAVACYPLREAEAWEFLRTGRLPDPDAATLTLARVDAPDPDGVLRLLLKLPRAQVPPGTERLGFPILFQFQDGWIHLAWYQSIVPEPVELPPPDAPDAPEAPAEPEARAEPAPPDTPR